MMFNCKFIALLRLVMYFWPVCLQALCYMGARTPSVQGLSDCDFSEEKSEYF